jgi:predicted membrane-bound spermidine synthase
MASDHDFGTRSGIPRAILSNAYGTKLVIFDPERNVHLLLHGTTTHGVQSRDPARAGEPLAYFHPTGPAGDVFATLERREAARIAIIGLGAGSLAAYARPRDHLVFYELDPDVVRIAQDPVCFTFLSGCRGTVEVVIGDGLAMLGGAPDGAYDLVFMDAFDSDCTPEHLYSREALELYQRKLAVDGLLAFNISNVHLDLGAIISSTAADLGLASLKRADVNVSTAERAAGKLPSIYLVVTGHPAHIHALSKTHRWEVVRQP